jgi:tetratricopeptide (TPR) repeat protein
MKKFLLLLIIIGVAVYFYKPQLFRGKTTQSQNPSTPTSQPGTLPKIVPADIPAVREVPPLDRGSASDGITLFCKGRFDDAIAYLQKDLSDPAQAAGKERNLAYIAKAYEYIGDMVRAEELWKKLLGEFPHSKFAGDAKYFLAQVAAKQGQASSSKKLLEEAAEFAEESQGGRTAALDLGSLYAKQGGDALLDAWLWYSKAIRSDLSLETKRDLKKALDAMVNKMLTTPQKIPGAVSHRVVKGDRLLKLAKKYECAAGFIRWVNHKSNDTVRIGEPLVIVPGPMWIEVRKSSFFLVVSLQNGLYLSSYEVGLGKDDKTPLGEFTIADRLINPDWYFEGRKIKFGDPEHKIGTRWLAFDNKPGISGFGIHGTNEPDSIGKNLSNGCVRLRNEEVEAMFELIPIGTRVVIKP